MAFNIDPKDLNLQDAAGMQLVEVIRNLAKESGAGSGLSDEAKQALMDCFENVAWANDDGQDYYNALYDALFGTTPVTPTLVSISAVFTQSSAVIYDTDSLNTLKQYLVVTATYSDSSTATVNDYTLSGTLTAGTSTITASYGGQTDTFTVNVTASVTLVSISAVFTQGAAVIYDTDSLDTLKQYLVVTATYSDSSTATVNDYTLSGTLTAGTSTITASYQGESDTFTVNVTAAPTLVSISAVFTQGSAVIYWSDSLDTLKQYLVVTATYSDSTTATITNYMLSGTLTIGETSTITASYGGESDTFTVNVSAQVPLTIIQGASEYTVSDGAVTAIVYNGAEENRCVCNPMMIRVPAGRYTVSIGSYSGATTFYYGFRKNYATGMDSANWNNVFGTSRTILSGLSDYVANQKDINDVSGWHNSDAVYEVSAELPYISVNFKKTNAGNTPFTSTDITNLSNQFSITKVQS